MSMCLPFVTLTCSTVYDMFSRSNIIQSVVCDMFSRSKIIHSVVCNIFSGTNVIHSAVCDRFIRTNVIHSVFCAVPDFREGGGGQKWQMPSRPPSKGGPEKTKKNVNIHFFPQSNKFLAKMSIGSTKIRKDLLFCFSLRPFLNKKSLRIISKMKFAQSVTRISLEALLHFYAPGLSMP